MTIKLTKRGAFQHTTTAAGENKWAKVAPRIQLRAIGTRLDGTHLAEIRFRPLKGKVLSEYQAEPREILLHDREHIVLVATGLACGVDADALGCLKPSAYLLNAARGRVVDQPALADALARRQIRGAALDVRPMLGSLAFETARIERHRALEKPAPVPPHKHPIERQPKRR